MPMNENENRKNDRTEATEDIKPIVIGSDGSLEGGGTRVNSGALSDKASDNAPTTSAASANPARYTVIVCCTATKDTPKSFAISKKPGT